MQTIEVKGQIREIVGKKDSKSVRLSGNIPCILYGGKDILHFTIKSIPFNKVIITPNVYIIKLDIGGKEYSAILKEVQFHPVSDAVIHVDFLEISEDKPFSIKLPIKIVGVSDGVKQGGKLQLKMRKVKVNGLTKNLPDTLEIDITKLNIGQSIKIETVVFPNLKIEEPKNAVICSVNLSRAAAKAVVGETPSK